MSASSDDTMAKVRELQTAIDDARSECLHETGHEHPLGHQTHGLVCNQCGGDFEGAPGTVPTYPPGTPLRDWAMEPCPLVWGEYGGQLWHGAVISGGKRLDQHPDVCGCHGTGYVPRTFDGYSEGAIRGDLEDALEASGWVVAINVRERTEDRQLGRGVGDQKGKEWGDEVVARYWRVVESFWNLMDEMLGLRLVDVR